MMRQAPVAQAQAGLDVQAAFVGAAVQLAVVHAVQHAIVDGARAAGVEDAGDAAHVSLLLRHGARCSTRS